MWQKYQWGSVDCQVVEEATTRQTNMVEGFPNFAHSWDIHQNLLSYLHATQVRPQLHVVYEFLTASMRCNSSCAQL